ncbi:hypothetical protein ES705_13532 [subsurface metagenome]
MDKSERIDLLKNLEYSRNSKIVSYIAGDRRGFETKIASDILPLLYEHLNSIGKVKNIDIFLYGIGGITMASWQIVNLFR